MSQPVDGFQVRVKGILDDMDSQIDQSFDAAVPVAQKVAEVSAELCIASAQQCATNQVQDIPCIGGLAARTTDYSISRLACSQESCTEGAVEQSMELAKGGIKQSIRAGLNISLLFLGSLSGKKK